MLAHSLVIYKGSIIFYNIIRTKTNANKKRIDFSIDPFFLSVHILGYTFESVVKHLGMQEVSLKSLECGGIVVAVADTFIGNHLNGDEVMSFSCAISLDSIGGKYVTV